MRKDTPGELSWRRDWSPWTYFDSREAKSSLLGKAARQNMYLYQSQIVAIIIMFIFNHFRPFPDSLGCKNDLKSEHPANMLLRQV